MATNLATTPTGVAAFQPRPQLYHSALQGCKAKEEVITMEEIKQILQHKPSPLMVGDDPRKSDKSKELAPLPCVFKMSFIPNNLFQELA